MPTIWAWPTFLIPLLSIFHPSIVCHSKKVATDKNASHTPNFSTTSLNVVELHSTLLRQKLSPVTRHTSTKACLPLGDFSREQAKSECDWVVMSSVFVASQSSCFFVCSREQIRLVENRLKTDYSRFCANVDIPSWFEIALI